MPTANLLTVPKSLGRALVIMVCLLLIVMVSGCFWSRGGGCELNGKWNVDLVLASNGQLVHGIIDFDARTYTGTDYNYSATVETRRDPQTVTIILKVAGRQDEIWTGPMFDCNSIAGRTDSGTEFSLRRV